MGFALAPEFGGTIHGYCGDTLDADLLDLLEWQRKPTMDDQHKAYVGKSRTREADHTLIVQPYSPHLFRQGELPGPNILMNFLRKKITTEEAKKAWKKVEKAKTDKSKKLGTKKWLDIMPLPCRNCSNEADQSTWKSLNAFTQYRRESDLWKHVIAKGQDLVCARCLNKQFLAKDLLRRGKSEDRDAYLRRHPNVQCDQCTGWDIYTRFDDDMVDRWLGKDGKVVCKRCLRGHHHEKRIDIQTLECESCRQRDGVPKKWPINCFLDDDLAVFRVHKTLLKCAACKFEEGSNSEKKVVQKCNTCLRDVPLRGPPDGFSPIFLRRYLEGCGNRSTQGSQIYDGVWKCYACQYPQCKECGERPEFAGPSKECYTGDGKYMCAVCRRPPCVDCKKSRPMSAKYGVERMTDWMCDKCVVKISKNGNANDTDGKIVCRRCHVLQSTDAFPENILEENLRKWNCKACQKGPKTRPCTQCGKKLSDSDFDIREDGHLYKVCRKCQHPNCDRCGTKRESIWTPNPREKNPDKLCDACEKNCDVKVVATCF